MERKPEQRRTGGTGRIDINRRPAGNSGTIRENLERYRPDSVSAVKASQAERNMNRNRQSARERREYEELLKRQRRKKLIIRLAVTLFVILICVGCFLFTYRVFYDEPLNEEDETKVEVTIADENVTDEEVGRMLVSAGVIKDANLYKLRTFIYDADYVPGTYEVSASYTTEKIINILSGYDYSNGLMDES